MLISLSTCLRGKLFMAAPVSSIHNRSPLTPVSYTLTRFLKLIHLSINTLFTPSSSPYLSLPLSPSTHFCSQHIFSQCGCLMGKIPKIRRPRGYFGKKNMVCKERTVVAILKERSQEHFHQSVPCTVCFNTNDGIVVIAASYNESISIMQNIMLCAYI